MDIKQLTKYLHDFVQAKGWYEPDSLHPQKLRNLAISLSLESSEVLEHFQWGESLENPKGLSGELADVALYLLQLSSLSNIDLERAILDKLETNYKRTWHKVGQMGSEEKSSYLDERFRVTVFGGSLPKLGEKAYQDAQKLGESLGGAGYTVLTGGYIGTMEAVSRGASIAGGHVIGVTCAEIESWRPVAPNPWIKEELRFPTLRMRLYALIENCDAAIALPGGIGTFQEIMVMWTQLQIGAISPRPLILVGESWEKTIKAIYKNFGEYIPEKGRHWLNFCQTVDDALDLILSLIPISGG